MCANNSTFIKLSIGHRGLILLKMLGYTRKITCIQYKVHVIQFKKGLQSFRKGNLKNFWIHIENQNVSIWACVFSTLIDWMLYEKFTIDD